MILSGFLMYGAAQKNKAIGITSAAVLFVYLFMSSLSPAFFAVNMAVIIALSFVLQKINFQLLSGISILLYSVIIDIICFYFFPVFPINVSLGAYILAGIAFNLRSAMPAAALAVMIQLAVIVVPRILNRRQLRQKAVFADNKQLY